MKTTTANSIFMIGGVLCSAGSFVVAESSVLFINISCKNTHLRKYENRFASFNYKINKKK